MSPSVTLEALGHLVGQLGRVKITEVFKCLAKNFPFYPPGRGEPLKVIEMEKGGHELEDFALSRKRFEITDKSVH